MHALWRLPFDRPAHEVELTGAAIGVGVYSLTSANAWLHGGAQTRWRHYLALGYAAVDEREIEAGLACLAGALRERAAPKT